jgi:hypothetical protein
MLIRYGYETTLRPARSRSVCLPLLQEIVQPASGARTGLEPPHRDD